MGIRRINRRHLPTLELGNPIVREKHEYIDGVSVAARLERGRAGVSRGCANDGKMLVPSGQHCVEHPPDELQREVLERKRRPVKQLEQPEPLVKLNQWHYRGSRKPAICRDGERSQVICRKCFAAEQRNDARGKLSVWQAGIAL
jgi:hypothetical protein